MEAVYGNSRVCFLSIVLSTCVSSKTLDLENLWVVSLNKSIDKDLTFIIYET